MYVDRKILEEKNDKELELYISPNDRYVSKSIEYAFNILKNRGRRFSLQEEEQIRHLIDDKKKAEEIHIHENHIKAGNLVYLSGAIGIGIFIWKFDQLPHPAYNVIPFLALVVIFAMGYLMQKGVDWMRFILLGFVVVGTLAMPIVVMNILNDPILTIANAVQGVLQIWALVLMFKIPENCRNKD